jgi:WD40 repeat protein
VRLWDIHAGQLVDRLTGHTDCVSSVSFTPDAKGLISGSQDLTAKHWDLAPLLRNKHRSALRQLCEEGVEDAAGQDECLCTSEFKGHEVRRRSLRFASHFTLHFSLLALVNLHSGRMVILMSAM